MRKRIYIYSPSGAVRDRAGFQRAVKRLQALGHEVEVDVDALRSTQRFAGDDACRLTAVHRAAESGADVTMISRGGYGLTRLLDRIHYPSVAGAIQRGMVWMGISDFTALQCAVLAQTGSVTWAGPALVEGFGGDLAPDDIMLACFQDLMCEQGEGAGWRLPRSDLAMLSEKRALDPYESKDEGKFGTKDGNFDITDALLWGGNLTVLTSLLGTPYFPHVEAGVLFLEDVGEHPYRIERMLTQLLHAGVLGRQQAILLGQFTGFKLTSHDRGFKLTTVVQWLRQRLNTPVLTGLPYGHVPTKVLLPVGARVDLSVQGRDALLVWGHL